MIFKQIYLNRKLYYEIMRQKYGFHNAFNIIFKRNRKLITNNGYIMKYNYQNKKDIFQVFLLSFLHGAEFRDREGFWHLDQENDIVINP